MSQVVTIGLDIAKSVFQLHGVDAAGAVLLRKRLPRSRMLAFFEKQAPCLIDIEACGSAHYWGRELSRLGHDVRLIPPSYVKPYVKRQKNDGADAEAICEAVTRPSMRFVPIKAPEQQSMMVAHRTRSILTRQRTQLSNAIRGHMSEFGLVAPVGRNGLEILISVINDIADGRVPSAARTTLLMLVTLLRLVNEQILESDRWIIASARSTEVGRRLMGIPGVGPVLASALVGTIADPKSFGSGRNLAAWIGSCRASILAEAKSDWAASPNRVIDAFGNCWWWAQSLLSVTRSEMARGGRGWCNCWPGVRRRSLRSRWRTRTPEWCGRS